MNAETRNRRVDVEEWWALIARILSFFLGGAILSYTIPFSMAAPTEKIAFVAVGVGMMGPVVIAGIAQTFGAIRGGNSK